MVRASKIRKNSTIFFTLGTALYAVKGNFYIHIRVFYILIS